MATFTPLYVTTSTTIADQTAIFVDTTGGSVTLTLPVADAQADKPRFIKIVAGTNSCILQPASGTINGVSSVTLDATMAGRTALAFFGPTDAALTLASYTWYVLNNEKANKTAVVFASPPQLTATTSGSGMNIAWDGLKEDPDSLITLSSDNKTVTFTVAGRYNVRVQVQLKIATNPLVATMAYYDIVGNFSATGAYAHASESASGFGLGLVDNENSITMDTTRSVLASSTFTVFAYVNNPTAGADYALADDFGTAVTTKLIITKVG